MHGFESDIGERAAACLTTPSIPEQARFAGLPTGTTSGSRSTASLNHDSRSFDPPQLLIVLQAPSTRSCWEADQPSLMVTRARFVVGLTSMAFIIEFWSRNMIPSMVSSGSHARRGKMAAASSSETMYGYTAGSACDLRAHG